MKKTFLDKEGSRAARHIATIASLLVLSTGLYIQGYSRNIYLKNHSATALGTSATFERSSAKATIKDYYTDESESFIGVTISVDENSSSPLPYKATDYLILLTDYEGNQSSIPAIFGRMGTDGDLFLIIPKPTKEVYHIVIANRNYLGNDIEIKNDNKVIDTEKGSIARVVSEANTVGAGTGEIEESKAASKTKRDSIKFQLTLNPALDSNDYKVTKLKTKSLLKTDSDGTTTFDFKTFWTMTYKQNMIDIASRKVSKTATTIAKLESRLSDFQKRYNENPDDEIAKSNIDDLKSQIKDQADSQTTQAEALSKYRKLKYDPSLFDDYSTKIFVYNK